jgi:hypothetical protein
MEKMKCLIFNTEKDYVRTKNFIKYTGGLFEHEFYETKTKIPFLSQLNKFIKLSKLKKNNWVYVPNLDPILVLMCRILNIRAISDILEPHPEMHKGVSRAFFSILERIAVKNSAIVLAVTREETENLKNKYKTNNLLTIRNFPDIGDFKPTRTKFKDFSIVYFGVCMPSRDLTNATKAIDNLQKEHKIKFHIIGDKKLLSQTFCKYKYHGWLDHEKSSDIIGKCYVGISPYENNGHCNLTLQNKAFQYAACNTIPLSTNLGPLQKYKEAVLTTDNSVKGWQKEIEKLYSLWEKRKLKFNQREIILKNNWAAENEWKKLGLFLIKRECKI